MYGTGTIENDKMLMECGVEVFEKTHMDYEKKLKDKLGNEWSLHFTRNLPNYLIKKSRDAVGLPSDYIQTDTDKKKDKKSEADGGIVYIKNGDKSICVLWIEGKSSFSVSKGSSRGQASGLITEQKERISSWNESIDNKIHPLISFCYGTDFNPIFGKYNISRIAEDLHTVGNCNPYEKNYTNSAWFYYQESFSKNEAKVLISKALDENFERLLTMLSDKKEKSII